MQRVIAVLTPTAAQRLPPPAGVRAEGRTLRYPRAWEQEFRKTANVAAWSPHLPDHLRGRWLSDLPGTLIGFDRHALMALLARDEEVLSITDLHVADVDVTVRAERGPAWRPPSPRSEALHAERIHQNWLKMRRHMGDGAFDRLQRSVIAMGFRLDKGEPHLFCFGPRPRQWFFAHAVRGGSVGRWQTNPSHTGWFDVSLEALGEPGRVRIYRLVADS
jgi:hypothetical protein